MYTVHDQNGKLRGQFFNEEIAKRVAAYIGGVVGEVSAPRNWWEPSWEDAPTNLPESREDIETPFE